MHTCSPQSVGSAGAVAWLELQSWMGRRSDKGSQGGNLEFVEGAGDSSLALCEGHRGIFNVHQLMPADGTPV